MQYKSLYKESYFTERFFNDQKRLKSFENEYKFFSKYISDGTILDVGCSTGEFLTHIKWPGQKYGMEISEFAKIEATKNGIKFDKDLLNTENFFDAIIFRGSIQHIDQPFHFIRAAHKALKPNGLVIFLATPNINSPFYRIWQTLPALDPQLNLYITSDKMLTDMMKIHSFDLVDIEYPYLDSPYSNFLKDHAKFIYKLIFPHTKKIKFPFWRSMMNVVYKKSSP